MMLEITWSLACMPHLSCRGRKGKLPDALTEPRNRYKNLLPALDPETGG